jgi:hypothetical protein
MSTTEQTFQYPSDFVARVKKAFPDTPLLHGYLDGNDQTVGRYLDEHSTLSVVRVLAAFNGGFDELTRLRNEAQLEAKRMELYREWCKIVDEWSKLTASS